MHKSLRKQAVLGGHLLFKLKANKRLECIFLLKNGQMVSYLECFIN